MSPRAPERETSDRPPGCCSAGTVEALDLVRIDAADEQENQQIGVDEELLSPARPPLHPSTSRIFIDRTPPPSASTSSVL